MEGGKGRCREFFFCDLHAHPRALTLTLHYAPAFSLDLHMHFILKGTSPSTCTRTPPRTLFFYLFLHMSHSLHATMHITMLWLICLEPGRAESSNPEGMEQYRWFSPTRYITHCCPTWTLGCILVGGDLQWPATGWHISRPKPLLPQLQLYGMT